MTDDQFFIKNELRITCADAVELVTEYLEETLSPADLDDFQTHLSLCEGCQVFLDQVNATITLMSRSRQVDVPLLPGNMDALLAVLDERAAQKPDEASSS